jgi:hypothetical protein
VSDRASEAEPISVQPDHPSWFDRRYVAKKLVVDCLHVVQWLVGLDAQSRAVKASWATRPRRHRDRAVVIAGGPSFSEDIAQCLVEVRDTVDLFAMNFFMLSSRAEQLKPDFYVLSDPAHLDTSNAAIERLNVQLERYLRETRPRLCVPGLPQWKRYGEPFLCFDDREALIWRNAHPSRPRGYCSNTAFKAIAIAAALGYAQIYVVGLDYDYPRKIVVDQDNKLWLRDEHHYGSQLTDFSAYFRDLGDALAWMAHDYKHLKKLAGEHIYNVTETSMIDAFRRLAPSDFRRALLGPMHGVASSGAVT